MWQIFCLQIRILSSRCMRFEKRLIGDFYRNSVIICSSVFFNQTFDVKLINFKFILWIWVFKLLLINLNTPNLCFFGHCVCEIWGKRLFIWIKLRGINFLGWIHIGFYFFKYVFKVNTLVKGWFQMIFYLRI